MTERIPPHPGAAPDETRFGRPANQEDEVSMAIHGAPPPSPLPACPTGSPAREPPAGRCLP